MSHGPYLQEAYHLIWLTSVHEAIGTVIDIRYRVPMRAQAEISRSDSPLSLGLHLEKNGSGGN